MRPYVSFFLVEKDAERYKTDLYKHIRMSVWKNLLKDTFPHRPYIFLKRFKRCTQIPKETLIKTGERNTSRIMTSKLWPAVLLSKDVSFSSRVFRRRSNCCCLKPSEPLYFSHWFRKAAKLLDEVSTWKPYKYCWPQPFSAKEDKGKQANTGTAACRKPQSSPAAHRAGKQKSKQSRGK